jgi:hypothetical protein
MDWLYHERNLTHKIASDYKKRGVEFRKFYEKTYLNYKNRQLHITGIQKEDIMEKVSLINSYLNALDEFNRGNWITQQSKFRPTVLEEFLGFLFKENEEIEIRGLGFFNKQIYAGMVISEGGFPRVKTKDVDFCIGKEITADFEGNKYVVRIPIIAIEAKTYIDKTMFNEAQFTASILKQGTPNVKVYVLAIRNEIGLDQIPSTSPLDEVFIVSGDGEIDKDTVYDFYREIAEGLSRIKEETLITLPGRLFKLK